MDSQPEEWFTVVQRSVCLITYISLVLASLFATSGCGNSVHNQVVTAPSEALQARLHQQSEYLEADFNHEKEAWQSFLASLEEISCHVHKEPAEASDRLLAESACHEGELVGCFIFSLPEPTLIENFLEEEDCAESAASWCAPDVLAESFASADDLEALQLAESAIFPNFVAPVEAGLILRGMESTNKKWRGHYGLDIIPRSGTRNGHLIRTVEDGTVVRVSRARGYGYYVVVYHRNGLFSLYSHLQKTAQVELGQTVKRGEVVGLMGRSGNARGVHLHFELIDLREAWNLDISLDKFVAKFIRGEKVRTLECNQFSKLLFNKQMKVDPFSQVPGLALAKREHGKWVAVEDEPATGTSKHASNTP